MADDVWAEYVDIRARPHHVGRIAHPSWHIAIETIVAHQAREAATLSALPIASSARTVRL